MIRCCARKRALAALRSAHTALTLTLRHCSCAQSRRPHELGLSAFLCHNPARFRCCAQAGKGSATLSMAYAAAEFAASCLRALAGEPGVVECAYVESHLTELPFFASPVRLGRHGVEARSRAAVLACFAPGVLGVRCRCPSGTCKSAQLCCQGQAS